LARWGMLVSVAENGTAALNLLDSAAQAGEPFRLILTDAEMPEMDGFALAKQIKQHPQLAHSIIVMLSSRSRKGDAARCREEGMAAYLTKPVRQTELRKAVLEALNRYSRPAVPAPAPPPSREGAGSCPLRILLAEDNMVNQRLARKLLEKRGHSVTIAGNGLEAVALLGERAFDLVLMDVQMPEMDGFEATAALRDKERRTGEHMPVIAMTAHAMKGDQERCLEAGMDGYVTKPINPASLYAAIEAARPAEIGV
jgi:two-component system sensor histidine kinase/response regulator